MSTAPAIPMPLPAQARQAMPAPPAQTAIAAFGQAAPAPAPAADFMGILSDALASAQEFDKTVPASPVTAEDPVGRLKVNLLPSPYDLQPSLVDQKSPLTDAGLEPGAGTNIVLKSFDHAVTLALFSQVVSGISSTTSSLIRQT